MSSPPPNSEKDSEFVVPPFYQRFKSHLSSYFKQVSHLEKVARTRGPKEGEFLGAVNKEILIHLGDETFDTRALQEPPSSQLPTALNRSAPLSVRPALQRPALLQGVAPM